MTELALDVAHKMAADLRAIGGIEVGVKTHDFAPKNADGTYTGEVLTRYSVACVIRDAKHGNTIVRDLCEPCDVSAVAADMAREVKDRAKATRARIRTERSVNRS